MWSPILLFLLYALIPSSATARPNPELISVQIERCPISHYPYVECAKEPLEFGLEESSKINFFIGAEGNFNVTITQSELYSPLRLQKSVIVNRLNQSAALVSTNFIVVGRKLEEFIIVLEIQGEQFESRSFYIYSKIVASNPQEVTPTRCDEYDQEMVITCNVTKIYVIEEEPADESGLSPNPHQECGKPREQLKLVSLIMNRLSIHEAQEYKSNSQTFDVSVGNIEQGQVVFKVQGSGNITVILKAFKRDNVKYEPFKVEVENNTAAFNYDVTAENAAPIDRWIAKIYNNFGQELYIYIRVKRDKKVTQKPVYSKFLSGVIP